MSNCADKKKHKKKQFTTSLQGAGLIHTDLVLDVIGHAGHFVEQTHRLIHPLINHTQVSQNLEARGKSRHFSKDR